MKSFAAITPGDKSASSVGRFAPLDRHAPVSQLDELDASFSIRASNASL